jgi:hypothetical protein
MPRCENEGTGKWRNGKTKERENEGTGKWRNGKMKERENEGTGKWRNRKMKERENEGMGNEGMEGRKHKPQGGGQYSIHAW